MLPSLIVIEGELVNPPTLLGSTPRGLGGPRLEAHSGVADVDEEAEVGQVDDSAQVQEHKLQMRFGGAVMGRLASELDPAHALLGRSVEELPNESDDRCRRLVRPDEIGTTHRCSERSEEHTSELQSLMRISY